MCRYKSEGDPNGRTDCDSLRDDNELVHQINEKLREEIRKLRKERRWIPLSESIPSDGMTVCVMACGISTVGFRSTRVVPFEWWTACEETKDFLPAGTSSVTHWQPLPPGPEDDR
jgi:hypothetical protein